MKQIYDFESASPPVVTERQLREELKRRELRRQTLLLRIASLILSLCFVLFAFLIAPDSMLLAVLSVIALTFSLIGNGIISLLFFRKGVVIK